MRSRYEYQSNSYARGVIQCLANDTIGNGPRLRYASEDDRLNSRMERDFTAWAETIHLGEKLRAVRIARARDGEAFILLAQNPKLRTGGKRKPPPMHRKRRLREPVKIHRKR